MLIWLVLGLVIFMLAYVRLAPSDAARWHTSIKDAKDKTFKAGAMRVVDCDLAALDRVARASGATVLAGSVNEGHITYINRSRVIGFPDYTTVQAIDGKIAIFGRLRFGASDLGVNAKRIEGWLAQL